MWLRFVKFVCQIKGIGAHRQGGGAGLPPRYVNDTSQIMAQMTMIVTQNLNHVKTYRLFWIELQMVLTSMWHQIHYHCMLLSGGLVVKWTAVYHTGSRCKGCEIHGELFRWVQNYSSSQMFIVLNPTYLQKVLQNINNKYYYQLIVIIFAKPSIIILKM